MKIFFVRFYIMKVKNLIGKIFLYMYRDWIGKLKSNPAKTHNLITS